MASIWLKDEHIYYGISWRWLFIHSSRVTRLNIWLVLQVTTHDISLWLPQIASQEISDKNKVRVCDLIIPVGEIFGDQNEKQSSASTRHWRVARSFGKRRIDTLYTWASGFGFFHIHFSRPTARRDLLASEATVSPFNIRDVGATSAEQTYKPSGNSSCSVLLLSSRAILGSS